MKYVKRLNDSLASALIIAIGSLVLAVFALLGSVNLIITLILLASLTALAVAFCLGSYVEQRELTAQKKTDTSRQA